MAKRLQLTGSDTSNETAKFYRRVLRRDPENAEALHCLALHYSKSGNLTRAIKLAKAAIRYSDVPMAAYFSNLGNFLKRQDRFDEAIEQYRLAISVDPGFDLPRLNLAITQRAAGQLESSKQTLEEAFRACPSSGDVCFELGALMLAEHRLQEAIDLLTRATQLKPSRVEAWINLGFAQGTLGRPVDAAHAFRQALKLDSHNHVIRTNLSSVFTELACAHESERLLVDLVKSSPSPEVFAILGTVYKDLGFVDLALDCYAKALEMNPASLGTYQNFLYTLLYDPALDEQEVSAQHTDWAQQFAEPVPPIRRPLSDSLEPERALRIGYVSGHFHDHAVSLFSRPMILAHDRSTYQITLYSSSLKADSITRQFQQFADQWRDISLIDDDTAAQVVRDDKIDILVDLAGHIGGNRLLLFARRPAPIQMTYLGYQHTTGMEAMDYRITDSIADPPGVTDHLYTEKLLRLDPSFFVYAPSNYAPDVAPPPCLQKGHITFGCFNNPTKHGERVVNLWADLLRRVPESRLLVLGPTAYDADPRVAKLFAAQGFGPDRVRFIGKRPRAIYLANYSMVDIALDPFPFSGHTTTCDALWQGVPVITLEGKTYAARMSVSTLTQAGFPEWIAASPEDYFAIAKRLAEDPSALSALRSSMRERLGCAPILDAAGFTKSLEIAYRNVWREHCMHARS